MLYGTVSFIFHCLNRFWSSVRWLWTFSEAWTKSGSADVIPVSSANVAGLMCTVSYDAVEVVAHVDHPSPISALDRRDTFDVGRERVPVGDGRWSATTGRSRTAEGPKDGPIDAEDGGLGSARSRKWCVPVPPALPGQWVVGEMTFRDWLNRRRATVVSTGSSSTVPRRARVFPLWPPPGSNGEEDSGRHTLVRCETFRECEGGTRSKDRRTPYDPPT